MTGRYIGRYLSVLGAASVVVGLYGSLGQLLGAAYPYPGGAVSDRIGSRKALTLFGLASTAGFGLWLLAADVGTLAFGLVAIPPWTWVFVGLLLVQAWKSFGLGATFAVVKQSVPPDRLATGFASTETVRRTAFLAGPLVAALLLARTEFLTGFQMVLAVALAFAALGTVAQHVLYDASEDTVGDSFEGVGQVLADLRAMPPELPPLLAGDTLVRFGNGMVHVFVVLLVVEEMQLSATLAGFTLNPDAFFGVLLAVEMAVALATMVPVAKVARRVGLKPVVATGFLVYATFPGLLVLAPESALAVGALFAFSGLRFAGLPAHKALIVGPAEADAGGRVTGTYYLVRNAVRIPAPAVGGVLYGVSPALSFGVATAVGLAGVVVFLAAGREFEAYA
jgi:MFS family permease